MVRLICSTVWPSALQSVFVCSQFQWAESFSCSFREKSVKQRWNLFALACWLYARESTTHWLFNCQHSLQRTWRRPRGTVKDFLWHGGKHWAKQTLSWNTDTRGRVPLLSARKEEERKEREGWKREDKNGRKWAVKGYNLSTDRRRTEEGHLFIKCVWGRVFIQSLSNPISGSPPLMRSGSFLRNLKLASLKVF